MARHKFKVGQMVDFASERLGVRTTGLYEVVRLLPVEAGEFLYRVKSRSENFERVARESQLSLRHTRA
jgi:hypothetical protein